MTFSDGSTITYSYAADGTKLRTVHTISGTTTQKDYCANEVYENGIQKHLLTEEGYVDLSVTTPAYYYYLKDHQGNNRVVINSSGTVQETNHYYPFGSVFASTGNVQPYKYNGKELDTKKGLNWYDYGARHYDAMLGRWFVVDPLVEKYYGLSPYVYCNNLPIRYIDPTGEDWKDAYPIFRNSVSAKITFGVRFTLDIGSIGVDLNAGSLTLGRMGYNDDVKGKEMTKGISIGSAIVDVNIENRVYETDNGNVIKDTGGSLGLLSTISLETGQKDIYIPYKNTYEKVESENSVNTDLKTDYSAALFMGVDIEINWSKVFEAIRELFK